MADDEAPLLAADSDGSTGARPAAQQQHPDYPQWFSPPRLLALFCGVSLLVYLDRGALSSNGVNGSPRSVDNPEGEGIQGDFDLDNFQDGLLPAAFMVGLLIASAAFAEASKYYNALRLIGVGLAIWTAGVVLCAAAPGFYVLLLSRAAMGAGEASFLALTAPFIDDVAPPKSKTVWFATFYMTNTAGYALGYMVGGVVGPLCGWRAVFALEALLMVPFVAFTLLAAPVDLRSTSGPKQVSPQLVSAAGDEGTRGGLLKPLRDMAQHMAHLCTFRIYVFNVCGQTLWTASVGALAFWGPKAARKLFGLGGESVDLLFGALTAVTAVVGTLGGAAISDRLGSSLRRSMIVSGAVTLASFVVLELSTITATRTSFPVFMAGFGMGLLFLFGASGPSNAVNMWSVPVDLRPQAVSFSTIMSHLLGDVPSPPLLGRLQDAIQQWDVTLAVTYLLILASGAFYLCGAKLATQSDDHRVTEPNPNHPEEAEQHQHDDEVHNNSD